jgi:tRNA uridine 5-carboxymethylaminomethyl modification enzyme
MLREDNADLRLTETGHKLGLVDGERWRIFDTKRSAIEAESQRLRDTWIRPEALPANEAERVLGQKLSRESNLLDLLRRPDVTYHALMSLPGADKAVSDEKVAEQVEIQAKYSGYIQRQREEIVRQRRHEDTVIPEHFDYHTVKGLSAEVQEKLLRIRPETIGQASRIPGVTPAAISLLLVYLKKKQRNREQKQA